MPMAEQHHTPHRRSFLAALATLAPVVALPAVARAAAPADDDAELIRLGTEFERLYAEVKRLEQLDDITDEMFSPANNAWWGVVDGALEIPATTLAGLRVKAAMIEPIIANTDGLEYIPPAAKAALSLARDVLAMGRA